MRHLRKYEGFMRRGDPIPKAQYYFALDVDEAIKWAQGKREGSPEPYVFDYDVCKMGYGDGYSDLSEEDAEEWIKDICPWYDPNKPESVENSLNVTNDFENAEGWDEVVIGINSTGNIAQFTNGHFMLEECQEIEILFFYYKDKVYTPEEFVKKAIERRFDL